MNWTKTGSTDPICTVRVIEDSFWMDELNHERFERSMVYGMNQDRFILSWMNWTRSGSTDPWYTVWISGFFLCGWTESWHVRQIHGVHDESRQILLVQVVDLYLTTYLSKNFYGYCITVFLQVLITPLLIHRCNRGRLLVFQGGGNVTRFDLCGLNCGWLAFGKRAIEKENFAKGLEPYKLEREGVS